MLDPNIIKKLGEYIHENLKKGYSLKAISDTLLKYNYQPELILEVVKNLKLNEEASITNAKNTEYKEEIKRLEGKIENLNEEVKGKDYLLKIYKRKNKLYFSLFITTIIMFFVGLFFCFYWIGDLSELFEKSTVGSNIGDCVEDWICNAWSSCDDNQKTRTCTDQNACGTESNKPELILSCSLPVITIGTDFDENISENSAPANTTQNISCDNLNGDMCSDNEVCNGNLLNSIEQNCCSISCVQMNCVYTGCNSINTLVPCNCGTATATSDDPWCCASANQVFSTIQNENCIFCGGDLTPPGSP